jgi:hypothetical protein
MKEFNLLFNGTNTLFGCQRQYRLHFCRLLNVCGVSVVKQTEIHRAEPLVPLIDKEI